MPDTRLELSDEARRRIRAEEIFRAEVQRELLSAELPQTKSRLAGLANNPLLNKPIVLWFLSSVVLAVLGWAYNEWEDRREAAAVNRAEITRLQVEIFGRMERAKRRLDTASNPHGFGEAIGFLDEGTGIIPALSDRSLESLLVTLSWLVPDTRKTDVASLLEIYKSLRSLADNPGEDTTAAIAEAQQWLDRGASALEEWRR